jgi:hypothetical protein
MINIETLGTTPLEVKLSPEKKRAVVGEEAFEWSH